MSEWEALALYDAEQPLAGQGQGTDGIVAFRQEGMEDHAECQEEEFARAADDPLCIDGAAVGGVLIGPAEQCEGSTTIVSRDLPVQQ